MAIMYEFINAVSLPEHFESDKQYTTEVTDVKYTGKDVIICLKYLGEEYTPNNPNCLMPVKEEIDWLIHPFVD